MKDELKILYIASNGHSGSTLLDILCGSEPDHFSAGELSFITRDGILKEYCSCGEAIGQCVLWNQIIDAWCKESKMTLADLRQLRNRFEPNRNVLNVIGNHFFPSNNYLNYVNSLELLYEKISLFTKKKVIVDSSKAPLKIPVLMKMKYNVTVVHLTRDFKGVLNSAKKHIEMDMKNGYEVESKPRRSKKVFIDWVLNNILIGLFSRNKIKIRYDDYIYDSKILNSLGVNSVNNHSVFSADHMLAGNALRLKKDIRIDKSLVKSYQNLNKKQFYFADLVDKMFPYWG